MSMSYYYYFDKNSKYPLEFSEKNMIGCLAYADDIKILSKTSERLQELLQILKKVLHFMENNSKHVKRNVLHLKKSK